MKQRGFTLIELSIVIAIIGIAAAIFMKPLLGMFGGFMPDYSQGERTGVVQKISQKGLIWKSYEGEMLIGTVMSGEGAAMAPMRFFFSVVDQPIVEEIATKAAKGERITLSYRQYLIKPITIDTDYVITGVK